MNITNCKLTRQQCINWIADLRSGKYSQEEMPAYNMLGTILHDYTLVEDHLAMMNDTGASFLTIANWIETNLLPACQP